MGKRNKSGLSSESLSSIFVHGDAGYKLFRGCDKKDVPNLLTQCP